MGANEIILDPEIRNWVLLPLTFIMVLMGLGRHFAMKLMRKDRRAELEKVRDMSNLGRAQRLCQTGWFLTKPAFESRKEYFTNKENGVMHSKANETPDPMQNPMMSDPNMMMDMMGNNMIMIVPNLVMMPLVNHFFSGFLTAKLPFSLTPKFKMMLQRGVEVTSLDVSYVSSLSWYFMLWMGLRGVMSLILGDNNEADEAKLMEMQMSGGMGAGNPQQQMELPKIFAGQADNIEMMAMNHKCVVGEAEKRLLQRPPSVVIRKVIR